MKDKEEGIEVPELLNYIIVRLNRVKNEIDKEDDDLQKCCYTLKNAVFFKECPEEIKGSPYENFVNLAEIANFTIDKSKSYYSRKMNEDNIIIMQEVKFLKGKKEGLAEGKAEGINEEKRRQAKALLEHNVDIDIIASVSGLSIQEIREL